MFKNFGNRVLFTVLLFIPLLAIGTALNAYADSSDSTMVGTLSAVLDSQNGTATAMFVGYCEGKPVIIGPSTWATNAQEFSNAKAEDIGNTLCRNNCVIKQVTKSTNTGKEIVSEVVIVGPTGSIMVGR